MSNSLDVFLFDRMDVYCRLNQAIGEAENRFREALGDAIHVVVAEILGDDFENTFGHEDWDTDWQGHAFDPRWTLELDREANEAWEKTPSLWFPVVTDSNEDALFRLLSLADPGFLDITIWAQPLSESLGDLALPKSLWEQSIAASLRPKGWEPYGERVTKPNGDWGLRHAVSLNHREIAAGLRKGDLRPALAPLEKLINDFASICPAMNDLVEKVRAARKSKTARQLAGRKQRN